MPSVYFLSYARPRLARQQRCGGGLQPALAQGAGLARRVLARRVAALIAEHHVRWQCRPGDFSRRHLGQFNGPQ